MIEVAGEQQEGPCIRHAQVLTAVYNANGCTKEGSDSPFEVNDFLPDQFVQKKTPLTLEEYYRRIEQYTKSVGGEIRKIG